jgi:hypothetical protein
MNYSSDVKGKIQLRINNFSKYAGLKETKIICSKQIAYINKLPFKILAYLNKSEASGDADLGVYIAFNYIDKLYSTK